MQLLWDEGRAREPLAVANDAAGARLLADLYAPPADRTWVRAMMNTTIDGSVTGADGSSGTLRNPDDSLAFAVLRDLADVVLVGAGTVRAEDYSAPAGHPALAGAGLRPGGADTPTLAILTGSGDLPELSGWRWPVLLLCPAGAREAVAKRAGVRREQVLEVAAPGDRSSRSAPESAPESSLNPVAALVARGFRTVQLEGGPGTLGGLVAAGAVDELCFSVSHRTVGGDGPRVLTGPGHVQDWRLWSLLVGDHATVTRYRRDAT